MNDQELLAELVREIVRVNKHPDSKEALAMKQDATRFYKRAGEMLDKARADAKADYESEVKKWEERNNEN